ncbi:MAG: glucose-1-phosphate adenylyltransferase [Deltaproteobacteria bacterium]|nr:glucose-1-phosphate adenylyltransferase [Deltaproteobacteria bacterium]
MMGVDVAAMLLAGGRGTRLNLVAAKRAKPAVPFAGIYRIIDFTLTNAMASGIRHVGVLTQYRPTSLMEHLGDGESWDLWGRNSALSILPPSLGRDVSGGYRGTADAVFQNLAFLDRHSPRNVVILSGDHIYRMDYRPMLERHHESGADMTVACMEVPWEETHRFGVMEVDSDGRVVRFIEKSLERITNLANMGIYVFRSEVLLDELRRTVPGGGYDFGANVIPGMLARRQVQSYPFEGYWRDVGTLPSYWSANMDALDPSSGLDLAAWRVRTNLAGRRQVFHPPARLGPSASVRGSIVSRGCHVEGAVSGSILSPGVRIGRGATVVASVIMHDCVIEPGAFVANAVVDKDAVVGAGTRIGRADAAGGENRDFPTHLSGGLSVVGKGTTVPGGLTVGANCLIGAGLAAGAFPSGGIEDGASLIGEGG